MGGEKGVCPRVQMCPRDQLGQLRLVQIWNLDNFGQNGQPHKPLRIQGVMIWRCPKLSILSFFGVIFGELLQKQRCSRKPGGEFPKLRYLSLMFLCF